MTAANIEDPRQKVAEFLNEFQALIRNQKPHFPPRTKNNATLIALGLTQTDQWNILRALTVEDYVAGPEPDEKRKGFVWVFGKTDESVELYIKLKISIWIPAGTNEIQREPICISFHQAEWPLKYPFR